jgi:hypothetical protein
VLAHLGTIRTERTEAEIDTVPAGYSTEDTAVLTQLLVHVVLSDGSKIQRRIEIG